MATSQIGTNELINMQVGINAAAASVDSFGLPMIFDTQNIKSAGALVPIIGTYTSLAAVVSGGFASYTKAYKLAAAIFAQQIRPAKVKIASINALSSAELTAVEAADPTWYLCFVSSMVSADIQTVSTWNDSVATRRHALMAESQDANNFTAAPSLLSILNAANPTRTFLGCRKANAQVWTVTPSSAFILGSSVSFKMNGTTTGAVPFNVTSAQTLTDLATAIQALFAAAVCTASAAAGVITITALNPLIDLTFDTYSNSGGAGPFNTCAFLQTNIGAGCAVAEVAGYLIPQGLGQSALFGKTVAKAAADFTISQSVLDTVQASGGNCYVQIGNKAMWNRGTMMHSLAAGVFLFFDTIAGVDRMEQEFNDAVMTVLTPAVGKLPYNNKGILAIIGALANVASKYVSLEVIEPYNYKSTFTYPDISAVSAGDKSSRTLNGIAANFQSTGAIQNVAITVSVQA